MSVRAFLEMTDTQSSNEGEKNPALNTGGTSNRLGGGAARWNKRWKEARQCVQAPFFLSEWSTAVALAWTSDSNSLALQYRLTAVTAV